MGGIAEKWREVSNAIAMRVKLTALAEVITVRNVASLAISLHKLFFTGKPLDYHDRNVGAIHHGEISMQSSEGDPPITRWIYWRFFEAVCGVFTDVLAASLDKVVEVAHDGHLTLHTSLGLPELWEASSGDSPRVTTTGSVKSSERSH